MEYNNPHSIFGSLFETVQLQQLFPDGKTFVDMVPVAPVNEILQSYEVSRDDPDFDLKTFVSTYFRPEQDIESSYVVDDRSIDEHIEYLWDVLARTPDQPVEGSSKIALPHPYLVPGGRFREIYYWDSYFTMLGLRESGRVDMIRNMIDNFAHLIETYGHIPNGNRSYYLGRSQPPFFAMMVQLLAEIEGEKTLADYLQVLIKEHNFWMRNYRRSEVGNYEVQRYVDPSTYPRPESYNEDFEIGGRTSIVNQQMRSGAESGWDFSSRWQTNPLDLRSTHILSIAPVDLHCLLLTLESTIAKAAVVAGDIALRDTYDALVLQRRRALDHLFWNADHGWYCDFDVESRSTTGRLSLATLYPLWVGATTPVQAKAVHKHVVESLLMDGGVVTTTEHSGQQWDAPNGWAPLQWITVQGLHRYGYSDTALIIAERFCALVERVYEDTGRIMEKYNVEDISLLAGGGEYPVQDGFGWTNGVYLALKSYIVAVKTK